MRFLNPRVHGILDFVFIALLAAGPTLFTFIGIAATVSYTLAVAVLGLVLLTRYPYGLMKVIPFPVHGMVELVASVALVAMPWLLGVAEADNTRNFYVAAGVLLFAVWLVTDYRAAEPSINLRSQTREKVSSER